jgi:hypothetical protein
MLQKRTARILRCPCNGNVTTTGAAIARRNIRGVADCRRDFDSTPP